MIDREPEMHARIMRRDASVKAAGPPAPGAAPEHRRGGGSRGPRAGGPALGYRPGAARNRVRRAVRGEGRREEGPTTGGREE